MDGEIDEATRNFQREIRVGMTLLGLLALAFVAVLARRIWVENATTATATKKPVYLSKAERDALRARSKPMPLVSVNRQDAPKKLKQEARTAARELGKSEPKQASDVPDLHVDELKPEENPESKVVSFADREKPKVKNLEPQSLPKGTTEPRPLNEAEPVDEELSPTQPLAKPPVQPPPFENEKPAPKEEESSVEESRKGAPTESEGSRFSDPVEEEPQAAEPKAVEPKAAEPKLSEPKLSESKPVKKPLPEKNAVESPKNSSSGPKNSSEGFTLSIQPGAPVRKKMGENAWRRSPEAPTGILATARHIVREGETLKSIAKRYFDDESKWREIYHLNRAEIGDDFEYLPAGIKLKLPPPSEEAPEAIESDHAAEKKIESK